MWQFEQVIFPLMTLLAILKAFSLRCRAGVVIDPAKAMVEETRLERVSITLTVSSRRLATKTECAHRGSASVREGSAQREMRVIT